MHAQLIRLGGLLLLAACSSEVKTDVPAPSASTSAALERAASLSAACSSCHVAGNTDMPTLSGLTAEDIATSLKAYREDASGGTVMNRLARGYTDEEISTIATALGTSRETP